MTNEQLARLRARARARSGGRYEEPEPLTPEEDAALDAVVDRVMLGRGRAHGETAQAPADNGNEPSPVAGEGSREGEGI